MQATVTIKMTYRRRWYLPREHYRITFSVSDPEPIQQRKRIIPGELMTLSVAGEAPSSVASNEKGNNSVTGSKDCS